VLGFCLAAQRKILELRIKQRRCATPFQKNIFEFGAQNYPNFSSGPLRFSSVKNQMSGDLRDTQTESFASIVVLGQPTQVRIKFASEQVNSKCFNHVILQFFRPSSRIRAESWELYRNPYGIRIPQTFLRKT
jgi:hypothetical protein